MCIILVLGLLLQVEFMGVSWAVGVVTQGRGGAEDFEQWVTAFALSHSRDGLSYTAATDVNGEMLVRMRN
jgi:hypothetical protein